TVGAQQPWVSSSPIAGQFYFAGAPGQQPPGGNDDAVEIAFWNSVKDDKNPDAFQTYLASYPVSVDGVKWTDLGTHVFIQKDGRLGLGARSGQQGVENAAEFGPFVVQGAE